MQRIRVVVIEQHPLLADLAVDALMSDEELAVVGEAQACHDGEFLVSRRRPDVILLGLIACNREGLSCVRDLASAGRGVPVIVLGEDASEEYAEMASRFGASGYLTWARVTQELAPLVHRLSHHTPVTTG